MKVGTDGVLSGTWADVSGCKTILDVGSGSGLIALIAAQRSDAHVDAVEIDNDAYLQSVENINNSPWNDRISVYHASFTDYCEQTDKKYDLIVSNPPYFSGSLLPPDNKRQLARHDHALSLRVLIAGSLNLLTDNGRISLILPVSAESELHKIIASVHLFPKRITRVKPTPTSSSKRILIELSRKKSDFEENELIIEIGRHHYSEAFKMLTKDFYR